jgi:hypothetical protein
MAACIIALRLKIQGARRVAAEDLRPCGVGQFKLHDLIY